MKVPASVPDPAIRLLCADAAAVSFAPGFSPVSAIASKRKTVSKVSSPLLKGIETVCGAFDHVITPLKRDADERTHPSCHTEPGSFRRTRRDFLSLCLRASGLAALGDAGAAPASRRSSDLIDVNVSLSRWPFRRLRFDDTEALVAKLRRHRVTQAWGGSFEGLLHKDLAAVNARLASECRHHGRGILVPFGSINPNLPDWEEELRRCTEEHRMPGIRLHPNYHGYRLDDPSFARLLRLAAERRLLVQLALVLEDERMMHRLVRVEPVDAAPLADLVRRTPGLRLVLLNALRTLHDQPLLDLIAAGEVYVEISMLEGVGGIGNLVAQVPAHRVLFGSHAPLFYFESAQLKLKESPLGEQQLRAIRNGNAAALLAQR